MAKKPKRAEAPEASSPTEEGLAEAVLATFEKGDYAKARKALRSELDGGALSPSAKDLAERLYDATRLDRTPLLVGLGCLALMALVIVVTLATQP
ncbi:MAG: hypothetical protein HY791_25905 [Deltaproteobacteria bacterium]|nr:hypothetical protein [Deltaproteobacteria bacterium]